MNLGIILGLVQRYSLLYIRNPVRGFELIFWPAMELLVWGFLTVFIQKQTTGDFALFIRFLIGATIFWDILFRAQMGVALSFLEDMWTRNLLNLFVTPMRLREYLAATAVMGLLRVTVVLAITSLLAFVLYAFNIYELEWSLVPFLALLMVFGFSLGLISISLILRWGQAAESLAWAVPYIIQPFSAVFYSVDTLPEFMQYVAWCIPSTYVFEGMRDVVQTGAMDWSSLWIAAWINLGFLAFASGFFYWMFSNARKLGFLTKIATQ